MYPNMWTLQHVKPLGACKMHTKYSITHKNHDMFNMFWWDFYLPLTWFCSKKAALFTNSRYLPPLVVSSAPCVRRASTPASCRTCSASTAEQPTSVGFCLGMRNYPGRDYFINHYKIYKDPYKIYKVYGDSKVICSLYINLEPQNRTSIFEGCPRQGLNSNQNKGTAWAPFEDVTFLYILGPLSGSFHVGFQMFFFHVWPTTSLVGLVWPTLKWLWGLHHILVGKKGQVQTFIT